MTKPMRRKAPGRAVTTLAGLLAAACVFAVAARFPHAAAVGLLLLGLLATRALLLGADHAHLVQELERASVPGRIEEIAVHWSSIAAAAVAGVHHPAIFVGGRLPDRLSPPEVRAVVLHERSHQLRRDPARLLVLAIAAPLLRRLPGGRAWLQGAHARLEIRADRYALDNGVTRAQLARALLELEPVAPSDAACFTSASDLRLRALLDPDVDLTTSAERIAARAAFLFAAVCALSVAHHVTIAGTVSCPWMGC